MKNKTQPILSFLTAFLPLGVGAQELTSDSLHLNYQQFEQCVLDYSQSIKQSKSQQIFVKKAMQVAKTNFLPAIDASGNYQYRINDYDLSMGEVPLPMEHDAYSAGFTLMQPIYSGGQVYHNYQNKKIQSDIAGQELNLTTDNVIYAAENSYWGTAAQKEMYEVMNRYSDIVGQLLTVLKNRYDDGMISKIDLLQMEVRKKEAEMQCLNAWEQYRLAMQNMNVLMGKNPTDSIFMVESISTVMKDPEQVEVQTAYQMRPELSILQLKADQQKNQIKLATSKYNPSLSVGFQGAWGTQMINLTGDTQFNSTLMVSLKVPLFHWGARFKEKSAQRALYNQALYAYQEKKDQVSKELAGAWINLNESKKRIELAKKNCTLADESLELNTFSYSEGRLSILDVLTAQLTWIQAYTNLVQSYYQEKMAQANYKRASGKRYR